MGGQKWSGPEGNKIEILLLTLQKMVVPEYQDGKSDDSLIKFQKVPVVLANTRQAGGQQDGGGDATVVPKIIVDIREFRSDLPCLIHRRGIEVVPVTITVNAMVIVGNGLDAN